MSDDTGHEYPRFEPLRPATRRRLALGLVVGPLIWLAALVAVMWAFRNTWAVQMALIVTLASFVAAVLTLGVLHRGRTREERRYVARG